MRQGELIFDRNEGKRLAEAGLSLAMETANKEHPKWSHRVWLLFCEWIKRKQVGSDFMIEDFRKYLYDYDLIEKPRTDRAFGFISGKALRLRIIEHIGTAKVKNKLAHATPANVWRKL